MAKASSNPFIMPGLGQDGEAARNPVFAGLEMMRQAWQGMAGNPFDAGGLPMMSIEDLDRRIDELRSVQNWLQLNVSILGNTIQGLEIQRTTLSAMRSFMDQGTAAMTAAAQPSGPSRDTTGPAAAPRPAADAAPSGQAAPDAGQAGGAGGTAQADATSETYAQAAGQWWNMLQQQFQTLADAATATMQASASGAGAAAPAKDPAPTARKKSSSTVAKTARAKAAPARKAAKTSTRSTAARKTKS